jgi:CO/xanthine dehydrogenase Mo-binding subunit
VQIAGLHKSFGRVDVLTRIDKRALTDEVVTWQDSRNKQHQGGLALHHRPRPRSTEAPLSRVITTRSTGVISDVPLPTNPTGSESGGTPALAAVLNAIVDALSKLGVCHLEMPATPERVWRTIREA